VANHPSAEKRQRQNAKRRLRNAARRARLRTAEKKLQQVLEGKNQAAARQQLSRTVSEIMRASGKSVLNRSAAARKVSRLSRAVHRALAAKK
jgi:small subunit ribosomal protein S20